jgi:metallo-beta-lactamase family protein
MVELNGHRFAVDCGMHQGNSEIEKRNWNTDIYEPEKIEFILVTHAHIDHTGLLPRLVKKGFQGPIYTTPPTKDLLKLMLLDSAHIQEMEAEWKARKRLRHGEQGVDPLYTQKDAEKTYQLFKDILYDAPLTPFDGLTVTFRDAGHILGASFLELQVTENGTTSKVIFSGDMGRPSQLIIKDPTIATDADFLFLESTYGNRNHKNEEDSLTELAEAIAYSYKNGEKVIIPAFAVERTQEIIYCLHLLAARGQLPPDMPVYVDSPLATQATEVFHRYASYFDDDAKALLLKGEDPLTLAQLRFTHSTEESMAINMTKAPAVVISASGMADAGRIKHHLKHNLWREGAAVVFVGFQAQGTTGRRIIDGAQTVRIFNEDVAVRAKIYTINGFSAHAGQTQLLDWLNHFQSPAMQIFLIHGEYTGQQVLADLIRERFNYAVTIPDYLDEITLKPGEAIARVKYPEMARPRIDWAYLIDDLEAKLHQLRDRKTQLECKTWVSQTDLRDRLLDVDHHLAAVISEI